MSSNITFDERVKSTIIALKPGRAIHHNKDHVRASNRTRSLVSNIDLRFIFPGQNVNAYHSSRRSFATPTLFLISCLPVSLRFSSINGTLPCLDNPFFVGFVSSVHRDVRKPTVAMFWLRLLPLLSVQSVRWVLFQFDNVAKYILLVIFIILWSLAVEEIYAKCCTCGRIKKKQYLIPDNLLTGIV